MKSLFCLGNPHLCQVKAPFLRVKSPFLWHKKSPNFPEAAGLRLDVITSNAAIASLGAACAAWPLALARLRRLTDAQHACVTTVTANAVMGACERRCPAEWDENRGTNGRKMEEKCRGSARNSRFVALMTSEVVISRSKWGFECVPNEVTMGILGVDQNRYIARWMAGRTWICESMIKKLPVFWSVSNDA